MGSPLLRSRQPETVEGNISSKTTLGEWLSEWLEIAIKPPNKRLRTYETHRSVIEPHLKPSLGHVCLQQLKPTDLKRYYNASPLSPSTLEEHHTLLHSALNAAQLLGLVQRNVASLVIGKPHRPEGREDALKHCWEAEEARQFVVAAKELGAQPAAFYTLALDSGARKGSSVGCNGRIWTWTPARWRSSDSSSSPGPYPSVAR